MRLLWVQQWAVLPVIVEDRDMVEENLQGGGLPQVEPSTRTRLGERERPTQARRRFPFFFFFSPPITLRSSHFFFPRVLTEY